MQMFLSYLAFKMNKGMDFTYKVVMCEMMIVSKSKLNRGTGFAKLL